MPTARVNGLSLFYEEAGEGTPLVFVHEFAGEARVLDGQLFDGDLTNHTAGERGDPGTAAPSMR